MIDLQQIVDSFRTLSGLRQSPIESAMVNAAVLSTTAYNYQSENPLLTLRNLKAVMPEFAHEVPVLDETAIRAKFTEWLADIIDDAIKAVVTKWYNEKQFNQSGRSLISSNLLVVGTPSGEVKTELFSSKCYGIRVKPIESRGLRVSINKVAFWFENDYTFTLRLFEGRTNTEVKSLEIVYSAANGETWFELPEWNLSGEHEYFLVYQGVDGNSAINSIAFDYEGYDCSFRYNRYSYFDAFYDDRTDPTTKPVLSTITHTSTDNLGLNIDYSIACDYTNHLIENRGMFASIVNKGVACRLLRTIASNPNNIVNRPSQNPNLSSQILYELDGEIGSKASGMVREFGKMLKNLQLSDKGLHTVCMSCEPSPIEIGAI